MSAEKQYYQCRLRRGDTETVGWIEARGAKAGASIELLPSREMWDVVEVFEHGIPEGLLKEHQRLHRNSPRPKHCWPWKTLRSCNSRSLTSTASAPSAAPPHPVLCGDGKAPTAAQQPFYCPRSATAECGRKSAAYERSKTPDGPPPRCSPPPPKPRRCVMADFTTDQIALAVEIPGLYAGTCVYLMRDGALINRFAQERWGGRLQAATDKWIAEHGGELRRRNADLLDDGVESNG